MPEDTAINKQPLVVLIVDDDFVAASDLARLFALRITVAQRPLEVTIVQTMAEGRAYAHKANVTLLDLSLPDSSPEETLACIKHFRPPVIIMTAHDDIHLRAQAKINGADGYVVKGQMINICSLVVEAIFKDVLTSCGILPTPS